MMFLAGEVRKLDMPSHAADRRRMMQAQPAVSEITCTSEAAMTWEGVHERYPEQWVVLVETDWIENHFAFRSTRVIGHAACRAEALAQVRPQLPLHPDFACFFTGRVRAPRHGYFLP